ncbi:hypothetical protein DL770_000228 [Monosporascus sp. CRB-9-2]|nr:hypothetical protein DL770_000228 [Monosporascus sp. CRB-9-2]
MDKQLDIRFDRVEKALGTLVDSIAKYNPSTHSAHDFVAADAELGKGLEELQTHQSNYRRLQELRAASASLDAQIKDTLRLLANTRKELVNAPATVFPEGSHYAINYDELLSYARMISPTTIPPVGAINGLPAHGEPQGNLDAGGTETAATTPGGPGAATPVGGGATPNGLQNGATSQPPSQPPADQPGSAPPASQAQHSQQTVASFGTSVTTSTTLPEHLSAHLNPHAQTEFAPWPGEDKVRQGSLAALAFLAERGIDPEGYDPEEEAEQARRRKAEEEEERSRRADEEDRERRIRHEEQLRQRAAAQAAREREAAEEAEAWRRSSVGGAPPSASSPVGGEKRQFQFMGDLDDDDD